MPSSDKQLMPPGDAAEDASRKPMRRRGWRIFFSVFKWCRIAILLALFALMLLGLFLNRAGLPEWIKRRVVAQMRAKGWEIEFSRMRLRWYRGIVAEDLQLHRTNSMSGPHLFVDTAEFRLNGEALRDFDLHADSVRVQGARLIWPLPGTNQPKQTFVLNKVHGELFFNPNDRWELRSLDATSLGARIHIRGDVTNASFVRDWKLPEAKPRKPGEKPGEFWQRFLAQADKVRLTGQPEVTVIFSLDAREFRSLEASVKFFALGLDSPWAGGTNVVLSARIVPPRQLEENLRVELKLNANRAQSRWATGTNLQLALQVEPSLTHWLPTNGTAIAELHDAQTPWGRAARVLLTIQCQPMPTNTAFRETQFRLTAEEAQTEWGDTASARIGVIVEHSATNFLPALVQSDLQISPVRTLWATSDWARAVARFQLPAATNLFLFDTNLSWQTRLKNIPLESITVVSNLHASKFELAFGMLSNRWESPQLQSELTATSRGGDANARAGLDVESRELSFAVTTQFDPRQIAPWFGTNVPRWFADVDWRSPLKLETKGRARLPAWTNREPDWKAEVLPTAAVAGRFDMAEGAYRQVRFTNASGLFLFTNFFWSLPELTIGRPEGNLEADCSGDQRSGQFQCNLRSGIDLMALRPLFAREADEVFAMFQFTAPPAINARAVGNWNDLAHLGVAGDVSGTNLVFRDQPVKSCTARVLYTNQFLSILQPVILREGERGAASGIGIDLAKPRLYLTNASGNLAPMAIARAIGDHIVRAIEPYTFDSPPNAHVEGEVPLSRSDGSERMSFDLDGGRFHWRNFYLDRAKGLILWQGAYLTLTNLQGRWHGGDVEGWAHFDFNQPSGGAFEFRTRVQGSDLKAVLDDVHPGKTNRIEGTFGGELYVAQAYCDDLKSWFGHGHVYLRDGLLWDIPIFGVFSPVLNAIVPGLGNSRAKQGTATFQITNSIFYSKDIEIRATAMRMQYQGTLDFNTRVDARMEAELLRDMPGIGLVISKVLWPVTKLFEYRVTGTLDNPRTDPIWGIPRVILFPFQPIKTLKDIFGEGEKKPDSRPPENAPGLDEKPRSPK